MHDDEESCNAAEFAQARQGLSTEANVLGEARYGRGGRDQFRAMPSRVSTAGPPSPSVAARQAHRQRNFAAHRKLGNLTMSPSRKQRVQPWSRYSLQVIWQVVRDAPMVLLGPLLLFLLCCGLGTFGVLKSAQQSVQAEQAVAKELVADAARHVELQMQQAFSPSITMEIQVQQQPYFPALLQSFEFVASRLLSKVLPGMIASLQLAPNGVIQAIYPLAGNEAAMGHDLLAGPSSRREDALRVIAFGNLTVSGPYKLLQGGYGVVLRQPVFVTPPAGAAGWALAANNGSSNASNWQQTPTYGNGTGQCDPTFGANTTRVDCPGTLCYDPATGKRFWGFAQSLARLDGLLQGNDARMKRLSQYGPWHLTRVYDNGTEAQLASSAVNGSSVGSGTCDSIADSPYGKDSGSGGPCVSVPVVLPNALWRLYLGKAGGWQPRWRAGLLALVVVGSFVVSGLLFGLLVNSNRHRSLLEAMFPKKVLAPLQQGKNFSEEFDSVTILFTDIVAYTTLSGQMKPIEVAEMLNELYTIFDEICERNGCYKVETIGDAFVAVGGCPDAEPPEVAAERVAHMALDMVAATAEFTSGRGHRLRIRVGLASGPIAAAVIGVKMPRYCLFGDTVNMASRMESNSESQRINLSPATAALLRGCASAAAFNIISRGPVVIKGKGALECFWLEPAQSSSPQIMGLNSLASYGSWELLQPHPSMHSTLGSAAVAAAAADGAPTCVAPGMQREARGRLSLAAAAAAGSAAGAARNVQLANGAGGGSNAAAAAAAAAAMAAYHPMPSVTMYSSSPTSTSITLAMASSPGATASLPESDATASAAAGPNGIKSVARDLGTGTVSLMVTPTGGMSPATDVGYGERLTVDAGSPPSADPLAAPLAWQQQAAGSGANLSHQAPTIAAPTLAPAALTSDEPQSLPRLAGGAAAAPCMAAPGGGGAVAAPAAGATATEPSTHNYSVEYDDDGDGGTTVHPDTTSLSLPAALMIASRGGIGMAAGAVISMAAAAASPPANGRSSSSRGTQLTSGSGSMATVPAYTATTNSTLTANSMLAHSMTPTATALGGLSGYSSMVGAGGTSTAAGGGCVSGAGMLTAAPAGSGDWSCWQQQQQQQHIMLIRAAISNADSESAAASNPRNTAGGTTGSGADDAVCSDVAVALGPFSSTASADGGGAANRPTSPVGSASAAAATAGAAGERGTAVNGGGDETQQPWKMPAAEAAPQPQPITVVAVQTEEAAGSASAAAPPGGDQPLSAAEAAGVTIKDCMHELNP